MKFDLVRPCPQCPFRCDKRGYLTKSRVREIINGITKQQATFSCHKTNEFDDGVVVETAGSQHCAGALIFLEKMERPNQMMRWMERLGAYDRTKLEMDSPVFDTAVEMVEAQSR